MHFIFEIIQCNYLQRATREESLSQMEKIVLFTVIEGGSGGGLMDCLICCGKEGDEPKGKALNLLVCFHSRPLLLS